MTTFQETRGFKPRHQVLVGILLLVAAAYGGLFYAVEAVSERDYSAINDPQLRVGYCMASNTSNSDKYLFAETTVRSPDLEMYSVVMPHALTGVITERKRAAALALRERDELRVRAVRSSFRVADYCGFLTVAWPQGITPLDVSMKWMQRDPTFLYYVERVKGEPDEADRVYQTLARSGVAKF